MLWKLVTLEKFPRVERVLKVKPTTKTWREIYRSQHRTAPAAPPKAKAEDFVLSFELKKGEQMLAEGAGQLELPEDAKRLKIAPLWELEQAREESSRKDERLRQMRSECEGKDRELEALRREVRRREGMLGAQQEQTAAVVRVKREREAACEEAAAKLEGELRQRAAELAELRGRAADRGREMEELAGKVREAEEQLECRGASGRDGRRREGRPSTHELWQLHRLLRCPIEPQAVQQRAARGVKRIAQHAAAACAALAVVVGRMRERERGHKQLERVERLQRRDA